MMIQPVQEVICSEKIPKTYYNGYQEDKELQLGVVFQNHARDGDIIPENVQNIPIEKSDGGIVKIQRCGFQSLIFLGKKKNPDILTGRLRWILDFIIGEIGHIVFITGDGTLFEVPDFPTFFKLLQISFIHNKIHHIKVISYHKTLRYME